MFDEYGYATGIGVLILFVGLFGSMFTFVYILGRQEKQEKTVASLVVTSNLRSISDIAHHSKIKEDKVIKILRSLISEASETDDEEIKYLKGATINLQTMEVILSDKYIEKEPWTCVYCRAVNEKEALVCISCHASKKKL